MARMVPAMTEYEELLERLTAEMLRPVPRYVPEPRRRSAEVLERIASERPPPLEPLEPWQAELEREAKRAKRSSAKGRRPASR
jgi:hypothetical protein